MIKKYNNLNEEIHRIKSLFTEERLYGNLVDKEPKLITEQKWSKLWNEFFAGLLSGKTKKFTFNTVGGDARGSLSIKKVDGKIELYRGGKKIDPSIDNIISSVGRRQINTELGKHSKSISELESFLEGDGYMDVQRIIINDLKKQGFMNDDQAKGLLGTIKTSNVGDGMRKEMFSNGKPRDDFFKNIHSMSDIKRINPEFYSYIEDIPGMDEVINRLMKKSGKVFHDDGVVDVVRLMRDPEYKLYDEWRYVGESDNTIRLDVDEKVWRDFDRIAKENEWVEVGKYEDIDEWYVTIRTDKLDANEKRFVEEALVSKKDAPVKVKKQSNTDIMSRSEQQNMQKQIDAIAKDFENPIIRKNRGVYSSRDRWKTVKEKIKNSMAGRAKTNVSNEFKETFSRNFRKKWNWQKWKREGWGKSSYIDSARQLNEAELKYIDEFLDVDIEGRMAKKNKSPFVMSDDVDLIERGYTEGTLHPNAKLKDNFRYKIYATNKRKFLKWYNSVFIRSGYRDYKSFQKYFGRSIKKTWIAWPNPIGDGYIMINIIKTAIATILKMTSQITINSLLAGDGLLGLIKNSYMTQCKYTIQKQINGSEHLSDNTKKRLFGQKTEMQKGGVTKETKKEPGLFTDIFKSVGVVKIPDDVWKKGGEPAKYAAIDFKNIDDNAWFNAEWTWFDVFTKDSREMHPDKVEYVIGNLVGTTKDSLRVVKHSFNGIELVALEVWVDSEKNLCSIDGENCKALFFGLQCKDFSAYFNESKNTDYSKSISDYVYNNWYDVMFGDMEVKDSIIQQYEKTMDSIFDTLDADDSGEINVQDVNVAADEIQGTWTDGTTGEEGPTNN